MKEHRGIREDPEGREAGMTFPLPHTNLTAITVNTWLQMGHQLPSHECVFGFRCCSVIQ